MVFPKVADWLSDRRVALGLSLRMTTAGLLSFALGEALGLAQVYWVVLTSIIVMQASVGGSLKATFDRFVGTIGGAAWGVAVAVAVPHSGPASTGVALGIALVPLAALVAFRPAYRVAPVTGAIVLLGHFAGIGVVHAALDRVLEIGFGSVVALAVALLISPARAQQLVGEAARDAFVPMGELARLLLGDLSKTADAAAVRAFHDRIRAAVERAAVAADEAARERRVYITETADLDPLVRGLRRLSHDLVIIARALPGPLPQPVGGRLAEPAATVGEALARRLAGIGAALAQGVAPPAPGVVADALAGFDRAIAELRRDGLTLALSDDDVGRVFGLSFGLEQMRRNIDDLAARAGELAARG